MAFSANPSQAEINVTPLIDVLLVLLIIFMVIVPQHQRGLNSAIPQGKASAAASLPPVTVQVVHHAPQLPAQYVVDQRVVPTAQLQSLLASMFAIRQDHTLIVQADRDLPYQQVANVVSLGKLAGADQVALK